MNSDRWNSWDVLNEIQQDIREGYSISIEGLSDTQRHHLVYSLISSAQKKAVYVAANDLQARKAFRNFRSLFQDDVFYFPAREKMLYDVEAKSHEQAFERINCLNRLISGGYSVIVLSCEAILDFYMPLNEFQAGFLSFKTGETINLEQVVSNLIRIGYIREQQVEGRGQFALRGGILDIFPVQYEKPIRIELFDVEIDSIRVFDIDTQRSEKTQDSVNIFPAREFTVSKESAPEIAKRVKKDLDELISTIRDSALIDSLRTKFSEYMEKLKNSENFPGIDKFIPYIYEAPHDIFEYGNNQAVVLSEDTGRLKQRLNNEIEEYNRQSVIIFE